MKILMSNCSIAYCLIFLCIFNLISTHLDNTPSVQFEYFQFTTKYSEFIVSYEIKSNSSLKLKDSM